MFFARRGVVFWSFTRFAQNAENLPNSRYFGGMNLAKIRSFCDQKTTIFESRGGDSLTRATSCFFPLSTQENCSIFTPEDARKRRFFAKIWTTPEPNLGTFLRGREKILRITSSRNGHKSRSISRNSTIILPLDSVKTWKNADFSGHFEHFGLRKRASASCSQIHQPQ